MKLWQVIFQFEGVAHAFTHVEAETLTEAVAKAKARLPEPRTAITGMSARREPVELSQATSLRLTTMSDEEAQANAEADPDNPPLTEAQLARFRRRT